MRVAKVLFLAALYDMEEFSDWDKAAIYTHARHESGNFKKTIGSKENWNLWGIKASRLALKKVKVWTHEWKNGQFVRVKAFFRRFDSPEEALRFYGRLIRRYKEAYLNRFYYRDFFKALQRGGWATDPRYAQKLIKLYEDRAFMEWKEYAFRRKHGLG